MALLTHLTVKVSGVIPAPVEEVWKVVRVFGAAGRWLHPVEGLADVKSQLLPGSVEGQIGGMRIISIGLSSFVEQLECLDEDARIMKWKLISHPLNTNPFPATFLNLKCCVELLEITREDAAFMVWTADFDTDFEGAEKMRSEITTRIETGFDGLTALLRPAPSASALLHSLSLSQGGAHVIGAGSPPSAKGHLARQAHSGQGMAGEIPAVRDGQGDLPAQMYQTDPRGSSQPSSVSQALQGMGVGLGEFPPSGSFSFPSFSQGQRFQPQTLPQQSFMDAAFLAALQQKKMDQLASLQEEERCTSYESASAASNSFQGLGSQMGSSQGALSSYAQQLQREYPNLDSHELGLLMAQGMAQARAGQQEGQQVEGPSRDLSGFQDAAHLRQSMERRGDSAGSESLAAPASRHISPKASPTAAEHPNPFLPTTR